jgi:hypothetical protein
MKPGHRVLGAVLCLLVSSVSVTARATTSEPGNVDCNSEAACPAIVVRGDPEAPATVPGSPLDRPSPIRGHSDPALRADPSAPHRLWMAYSWPYGTWDALAGGVVTRVDSHLARRDGNGPWRYVGPLWTSRPMVYPASDPPNAFQGLPGYSNSEAVSIDTSGGATWYSARMQYWKSGGPPVMGSNFLIKVAKAGAPGELATVDEQVLAGRNTGAEWAPDQRLSDLDPNVAGCTFFIEPALFVDGGDVYLALKCMVAVTEGEEQRTIEVFRTRDTGPVRTWKWSYAGRLADIEDAKWVANDLEAAYPDPKPDLDGSTTDLSQTDIVRGPDGAILVIVSPSADRRTPPAYHFGCEVLEVADLSTASLARVDGHPIVRLRVVASDEYPSDWGPAACTYDANSGSGVIVTRRQKDPPGSSQRVWSMNQTFVDPVPLS